MNGYAVETLVGKENCPLLLSKVRPLVIITIMSLIIFIFKVRALVTRSLGSTATGLIPGRPLVKSRIFSSLQNLVGKWPGLRVWVEGCGNNWPHHAILFNIRLGTFDAYPILMAAERIVLTSLKEMAASRIAPAIHWETVEDEDKEAADDTASMANPNNASLDNSEEKVTPRLAFKPRLGELEIPITLLSEIERFL